MIDLQCPSTLAPECQTPVGTETVQCAGTVGHRWMHDDGKGHTWVNLDRRG